MRIGDRRFIKADTGSVARGHFAVAAQDFDEDGVLQQLYGVVAMPNLIQVYGPARVRLGNTDDELRLAMAAGRERMAARARRQRLPSRLRYNPNCDPRLHPEWD